MDDVSGQDRAALVACSRRRCAMKGEPHRPREIERGDWLCGSVGYTEPDQHGGMAPILPEMWTLGRCASDTQRYR
jgi:hypothetical protein